MAPVETRWAVYYTNRAGAERFHRAFDNFKSADRSALRLFDKLARERSANGDTVLDYKVSTEARLERFTEGAWRE